MNSSLLQEEHLFKYPISTYSADVDEITNQVEPFYRLFNIVLKWQKAEKKYGSQSLMELSLHKSKLKYLTFSHLMDRRSLLIVDGINPNLEIICLKLELFFGH